MVLLAFFQKGKDGNLFICDVTFFGKIMVTDQNCKECSIGSLE